MCRTPNKYRGRETIQLDVLQRKRCCMLSYNCCTAPSLDLVWTYRTSQHWLLCKDLVQLCRRSNVRGYTNLYFFDFLRILCPIKLRGEHMQRKSACYVCVTRIHGTCANAPYRFDVKRERYFPNKNCGGLAGREVLVAKLSSKFLEFISYCLCTAPLCFVVRQQFIWHECVDSRAREKRQEMSQSTVSCLPVNAKMSKAKKVLDEARETQNRELDLVDKGISTFEELSGLLSMLNITRLTLSHNRITQLPPSIANLTNLEILNLANNHLRELPTSISSMPKLRILNLAINQLDTLPRGFGAFPVLEVLDLSYNNLNEQVLPGNFFMLETLRALYLGDNDFEYLPPEIGNLKNLQILGLRDNDLLDIPREIGELTRVRELHIQNNRLTVLPPEVANLDLLSNKSVMKMEENPWVTPIAEQYLLGISHVIEYLKTETYKILYNRHMQAGRGGGAPPKADKSRKASRARY